MNYYLGIIGLSACIVFVLLCGGQLVNALWTGRFRLADSSRITWKDRPRQFLTECILYGYFVLAGALGMARLVPFLLNSD